MKPSGAERCLYTHKTNGKIEIVIIIYVDDISLMNTDTTVLNKAQETLNKIFQMKDMGVVRWYLEMSVIDNRGYYKLSKPSTSTLYCRNLKWIIQRRL